MTGVQIDHVPLIDLFRRLPPAGRQKLIRAAAWGQPAGTLMHWQGDAGWLAVPPREGQTALVADEGVMLVYRGGWQAHWPVSGLTIGGRTVLAANPVAISPPGGGTVVDAEARATLAAVLNALRQMGVLAS